VVSGEGNGEGRVVRREGGEKQRTRRTREPEKKRGEMWRE